MASTSRPKVLQRDAPARITSPPSLPTPPAAPTLRPKASTSSVARLRRPGSPTKASPPTPSASPSVISLNGTAKRRPVSSQGSYPRLAVSPIAASPTSPTYQSGAARLQAHFDPPSAPSSPPQTTPSSPTRATHSRRTSLSLSPAAPAPPQQIRVKAKLTSLSKPSSSASVSASSILPASTAPPTRPIPHSRSTSMSSMSSIFTPTATRTVPIFQTQTLPPTPPRPPPPSQAQPHSPPSSTLSSRSSFSVSNSTKSVSETNDRLTPVPPQIFPSHHPQPQLQQQQQPPYVNPPYVNRPTTPRSPMSPAEVYAALPTTAEEEAESYTDANREQDTRPEDAEYEDAGEDERPISTSEARSNRKIADLEITNRSLLALNAALERTRHAQAKEIRDLRRRLRETRLGLPPRAFAALKATDPSFEKENEEDEEAEEDDSVEGGEGEGLVGEGQGKKKDEVWERVRQLVEDMALRGRRALEADEEDRRSRSLKEGGGVRVLSTSEVEELERERRREEKGQKGEDGEEEDERDEQDDGLEMHNDPEPALEAHDPPSPTDSPNEPG